MTTLHQKLKEIAERAEKATEGPWEYVGNVGIDYTCDDCGTEFPESGYAVKSKDEHQVLECHLYGMERFCKPDGEFIAHSRQDIPRLVKALEYAMKCMNDSADDNTVWADEMREIESILEGK